jgi:hypothetical protein
MLGYRTALRAALQTTDPIPGLALVASYASPDRAFVDVENAVLYNIGASAYAHLLNDGLYCQRVPSTDERHQLSYLLEPMPNLPAGTPLVSLEIDAPSRKDKPGPWWAAFRTATLAVQAPVHYDGHFAVDLTLPDGWSNTTVANALKPLLDGLVSALHTHEEHVHDDVSRARLMSSLAMLGEPDVMWSMLRDPGCNLLGSRALIRPHRNGIAWNPADERCHAFRVQRAKQASVHAEIRTLL